MHCPGSMFNPEGWLLTEEAGISISFFQGVTPCYMQVYGAYQKSAHEATFGAGCAASSVSNQQRLSSNWRLLKKTRIRAGSSSINVAVTVHLCFCTAGALSSPLSSMEEDNIIVGGGSKI